MIQANQSEQETPNANGSGWKPPESSFRFYAGMGLLAGLYILLILSLVAADLWFAASNWQVVSDTLWTKEIRYAIWLSVVSSTISSILALWVAVPIGYLMSRFEFRGKSLVDSVLDIPIFLPPLVIGLSLLILFRQTPMRWLDDQIGISLHVPAVIIAQFTVASAFAVRTMRSTFDTISPRTEQVALTLGASRFQAFTTTVLPQAWKGVLTAGTLAWARALGEFGPILVFAGTTRMRTEVLPVSVHLELSIGNIEGAVGVSLVMIVLALMVLGFVRWIGNGQKIW